MNNARLRVALAAVCCSAAVAVPGVAEAGESGVAAALKAQQALVDKSPAIKILKSHPNVNTAAGAKKLISEFGTLRGLLTHASTAVANASASTPTQKTAQNKIVAGLRAEASGVATMETGLKDLVAGHKSEAKSTILKGEKAVSAADVTEQSGVKMPGGATS